MWSFYKRWQQFLSLVGKEKSSKGAGEPGGTLEIEVMPQLGPPQGKTWVICGASGCKCHLEPLELAAP